MPLRPLKGSEASPATREIDPLRWPVRTLMDDEEVGRVEELLTDEEGVVRWIVVGLRNERRIGIPSGYARADSRGPQVWLPGLHAAALAALPDVPQPPPDRAAEIEMLGALEEVFGGRGAHDAGEELYQGDRFDETIFFGPADHG